MVDVRRCISCCLQSLTPFCSNLLGSSHCSSWLSLHCLCKISHVCMPLRHVYATWASGRPAPSGMTGVLAEKRGYCDRSQSHAFCIVHRDKGIPFDGMTLKLSPESERCSENDILVLASKQVSSTACVIWGYFGYLFSIFRLSEYFRRLCVSFLLSLYFLQAARNQWHRKSAYKSTLLTGRTLLGPSHPARLRCT